MKASIHRPTYIEVDLSAISYNLGQVVAQLPAQTQVFAVVKANAYGHGVLPVAQTLLAQVDGFCVSNIDEALELRQAGIEKDILVLGVVPTDVLDLAQAENLILTIASREWIEMVDKDLLNNLRFHIKVDTGMGRIGFLESKTIKEALAVLRQHGAKAEGIFTHFATADQADQAYFQKQLATFKQILSEIEELPELVHASNSATSIWHSDTVFNMVRLGDILYGLNPSGRELALPFPIKPALKLVSELVQVKVLEGGSSIGYGATYTSSEEEIIATVPIGYADGLIRRMQNFQVLVEGHLCPIVGRVSMDQITIRLPKPYPLGTKVTLIGQDGATGISAQDWADYVGTINYEVVCLLSDRIPRFYK